MTNNPPATLHYTGTVQPPPAQYGTDGLYPYLPTQGLVDAVNLALYLQRPLLLKGEPGSGKTRLARAVAYELYHADYLAGRGLPFEPWYVKSTSRARDGLYTYDAVRRLQDAQLAATDPTARARVNNPREYVTLQQIGRAYRSPRRPIVLIDEIDKADIDFPNDLLLELDEQRFMIDELPNDHPDKWIEARHGNFPLLFITSNDEKDLPDAFLRRCIFYYIDFPAKEELAAIVRARFADADPALVDAALERFLALRQQMQADKGPGGKKVTTSELLDWFTALRADPPDTVLAQFAQGKLPYGSALLKSWEDHLRYLRETPAA